MSSARALGPRTTKVLVRLAAVLLAATTLAPRIAAAATPTGLLVVPVVVDDGTAGLRPTDLERAAARAARDWVLVRTMHAEELFSQNGRPLSECGADVGCFARGARAAGAGFALVILADASTSPALVAVRLVSAGEGNVRASASASLDPNEEVAAVVEKLTTTVLERAGFSRGGILSVRTKPVGALVFVDGEPATEDPERIVVTPGVHHVRAERSGYLPRETTAETTAGASSSVVLELEEEPSSAWASPWLWVVIGAAAIAGGVAIGVALQPGGRCVCVGPGDAPCDC